MSSLAMSVVIPCFNEALGIRTLLNQLSEQTLMAKEYEVIVVDDHSTDNTRDIVTEFEHVILLCQNRQGPGAARNYGSQHARGELILFIDADLEVAPDLLKQHVDFHSENPEIAAVGGSVEGLETLSLFSWQLADHLASWFNCHPRSCYANEPEYLPSLNFSIKPRLLTKEHKLNWENGLTHTGEDVLYCAALRERGLKIAFHPAAIVRHQDRVTFKDYNQHMYRWGFHAPYVRGQISTLRYHFLFPKQAWLLCLTIPFIILGYTWLIWKSWLSAAPLAVTLALPQLLIGRLAYVKGVWEGTLALRNKAEQSSLTT